MRLKSVVGALALLAVGFPQPAQAAERPNVLLVLVDDMRVGEDFYSVLPDTMRMFSRWGTEFPNAVATTPSCCPSRASIFSGQYSHNHGVTNNLLAHELDQTHTMQYELQQADYLTAIAGKFLNKWDDTPPYFDKYALLPGSSPYPYYNATWNINGRRRTISGYTTDHVGRKGVAFLRHFEQQDDDAPWFMQLSPYAPHKPATPKRKYADARVPRWKETPATTESDISDKPPWLSPAGKKSVKFLRRKMLRTLMSVDDMVDRMRRVLRKLGETRDTMIIFMSDNGYILYEHQLDTKGKPYDPSVRLPFFVKWPGVLARGVHPRIVTNNDLAPTIYDAAGIEPGYTVDGRNFLTSDRDHAYIEYLAGDHPWTSLWSPEWTYVRYDLDGFQEFYDEPWQLENPYGDSDLVNDPVSTAWDAELEDARDCAGETCP